MRPIHTRIQTPLDDNLEYGVVQAVGEVQCCTLWYTSCTTNAQPRSRNAGTSSSRSLQNILASVKYCTSLLLWAVVRHVCELPALFLRMS